MHDENQWLSTEAGRRYTNDQSLASTRIEGHVPSPEFLADCEAWVTGSLSGEQVRAASLRRALATEAVTAAAAGDAA